MISRRNNTAVLYLGVFILITYCCYYAWNDGYACTTTDSDAEDAVPTQDRYEDLSPQQRDSKDRIQRNQTQKDTVTAVQQQQQLEGASLLHQLTGPKISGKGQPQFDPNGYVIFCLCMGNIGNQFDQFLGAIAFAKKLNRTIVVPTITYNHVPFTDWFKLKPLLDYHRAIIGPDFMKHIAPEHWPEGQRFGFCRNVQRPCDMTKIGGHFKSFWDDLGVKFDGTVLFNQKLTDDRSAWEQEHSADKYPVLAFHAAPGDYPMRAENRHLQKVLVFSDSIQQETRAFMDKYFPAGKFIAIHLRTGTDWEHACKSGVGLQSYMSSPQCMSQDGSTITQDICLPPKEEIIRLTKNAVMETGIKFVYQGTDYRPMVQELQDALQEYNVTVFWRRPRLPIIDLAIFSKSDHFIGNCVSSFAAFVKRARDVAGKPTSFWGQPLRT